MMHSLIDFFGGLIEWLANVIVGCLFLAFFVGLYVKLYERIKSVVMFFINLPHGARLFVAEAKQHLAPRNKAPANKTTRDDVSDAGQTAIPDRSHEAP